MCLRPPPLILTEVVSDYNDCCTQVSTQCCTCLRPSTTAVHRSLLSAVRVCAPQRLLYTGLYSVLYVSAPLNDCCTQVSTQCCTCLRPSTTAVHRSLHSAECVCAPPLDTDGSTAARHSYLESPPSQLCGRPCPITRRPPGRPCPITRHSPTARTPPLPHHKSLPNH